MAAPVSNTTTAAVIASRPANATTQAVQAEAPPAKQEESIIQSQLNKQIRKRKGTIMQRATEMINDEEQAKTMILEALDEAALA